MTATELQHAPDVTDDPTDSTTFLTISQVARSTRLSESVLRVWEMRYGWPRPRRAANGYRRYPHQLIALLNVIRDELDGGRTIGDLLRDPRWQQLMEDGRLPEPTPRMTKVVDWSVIKKPDSDHGREIRTRLELALQTGDQGMVAWAQAEAQRLRPGERERAVTAVLRAWREQH